MVTDAATVKPTTGPALTTALAEDVWVPVRVIAAPAGGVFRPDPGVVGREGLELCPGQEVGIVETNGGALAVRSPHAGRLAGLLAHPGERVRDGQPVAWVRVAT
jgi:biotin carboxyl carrier protein